jgi:DNA-binding Lrp family transcriptional regulator
MELKSEDFAILLALNQDPFMSMSELAKQINLPVTEATKRYEFLKSKGVIKNPLAIFDPESLGLERIHVITLLPDYSCLEIVEELCTAHPYTHYRTRIFGGGIGVFIQFDIPKGTRKKIEILFKNLLDQKIIISFEISESSGVRISSYPNLEKYNTGTSSWNFIWPIWFATLDIDSPQLPIPNKTAENLSKFTRSQAEILKLLTDDASITIEDICNKTGFNRASVEENYAEVKGKYISAYRFMYDREIFDLTETILAFGSGVDLRRQRQLFNGIKTNPPPFFLSLDILKDGRILIWITMSPGQASDFTYACWQNIPNFKLHVLNTKAKGSMLYCFYPENFDFEKGVWKTSVEYMIDDPLSAISSAIMEIQQ